MRVYQKEVGVVKRYGLAEYDAYQLLKLSGARLPIDRLYFIDPILKYESPFDRTFFIAGARHYWGCKGEKCEYSVSVESGEELYLVRDEANEFDSNAVLIVNEKRESIGYIPRYYSSAFSRMILEKRKIRCFVKAVGKNKCCSECILPNSFCELMKGAPGGAPFAIFRLFVFSFLMENANFLEDNMCYSSSTC